MPGRLDEEGDVFHLKMQEVEISGLDGTVMMAELGGGGNPGCVKLNHLDGTVLKVESNGKSALYPAPLAWLEDADAQKSSICASNLRTLSGA